MIQPTSSINVVSNRGYTLIEIVIAIAILSILTTIAVEAYTSQVQKSRRTDARSALLDLAGREEKLFTLANAYSSSLSDLGYSSNIVGSGYYQIAVSSPDATQGGAAGTYLITARPVPTGPQANDTTCTSLSVNQLGVQTATPAANAATCWGN